MIETKSHDYAFNKLVATLRAFLSVGSLRVEKPTVRKALTVATGYSLTKAFINEMRSLAAGACQ
jgi:hypothetical protein